MPTAEVFSCLPFSKTYPVPPEPRIWLKAETSLPDAPQLGALKFSQRKIKAGQTLFHEGDCFQFLHVMRSGIFKYKLLRTDGREQANGFVRQAKSSVSRRGLR